MKEGDPARMPSMDGQHDTGLLYEVFDAMSSSVVALDRDLVLTFWNRKTTENFGIEPDEMVGRHISDALPHAVEQGFADVVREVVETGIPWSREAVPYRSLRAGFRFLNMTISPLRSSTGAVKGAIVISEDVTTRHELERELKEQNRDLSLIQSITRSGIAAVESGQALEAITREIVEKTGYAVCNIFMLSRDGRALEIVAGHGGRYDMSRRRRESSVNNRLDDPGFLKTPPARAFFEREQSVLSDVTGQDDFPALAEIARKQGFSSLASTPLVYKDECLGALSVYTAEPHDFSESELSQLTAIAAQIATIAAAARAYQKLERTGRDYRQLYDGAADMIFTTDAEGVIRQCNETMTRVLGYTKPELVGRRIQELAPGGIFDGGAGADTMEGGPRSEAQPLMTRDGRMVWVEVRSQEIEGDDGRRYTQSVARDVTDKRDAQEKISLLATAVDNSQDSVIITDLNGDIIYINRSGAETLGIDIETGVGMHMQEFWAQENSETLLEQIYEATLEGGWQGQIRYRRADGSTFPAFVSSWLVRDRDGRPEAMVGISRDLSVEERMTREILKRNREQAVINAVTASVSGSMKLDEMLDSCAAAIFDSMSFRHVLILTSTRRSRDFVLKAAVSDRPGIDEMKGKVFPREEGLIKTVAVTRKPVFVNAAPGSGKPPEGVGGFDFTSMAVVPIVSRGQLFGAIIVAADEPYDFNERERQLLESVANAVGVAIGSARLFADVVRSKNEWEATFDSMTNGVSIHDRDFTIMRANKALASLLNTTPDEIVGRKCYEVFHGADHPLVGCPGRQAQRTGRSQRTQIKEALLGKSLAVSVDPIKNNKGELVATVHDIHDITEQEQLREQLVFTERIRALGQMAGGVAHDFNNYLTVIMGNAQLLLTQAGQDDDFRESLEAIQRTAGEAAETVRRIQEFTGVRTVREYEEVDLNKVINEAVEVTRYRWKDEAEARGVNIAFSNELGEIPAISGNRSELGEVIMNLILNSCDAMPGGGEISIRTATAGDCVELTFTDNGVGMESDVKKRIFDPFYTTKEADGVGLGLSVVYGIISRHGGEIIVDSKPGEGTSFTIYLPRNPDIPRLKPDVKSEKESRPGKAFSIPAGSRVLVIDDVLLVRELLGDLLGRLGIDYVTADDGIAGIELFEEALGEKPFDLVITDLGMPGLSGWEVIERVRKLSVDMPVALITGWGDQLDEKKMSEAKVDFVIAKPFDIKSICSMLERALEKRGAKD